MNGQGGIRTHDHRRVRASLDDRFVHKLKRVLSSTIDEKIVQRELELYENYLCMLNRSSSTIKDRIIYLRKFLYSGFPLTSEGIIDFINTFKGDGKIHATKAICIYLKS